MSKVPSNSPPRTYDGFESAYFDTLVIQVPVFDEKGAKTGKRIPLSLPVYKAIALQGEPDDNTPFVPLGISYDNIWMEASTIKRYLDPIFRKGDYHSITNKVKELPFNTWDQSGTPLKSLRPNLFLQPDTLSEDKWDAEQEKLWYTLLMVLQQAMPKIPESVSAHFIQSGNIHMTRAGSAITMLITKGSEDAGGGTYRGLLSAVNTQRTSVSRPQKDGKKRHKNVPDSSTEDHTSEYCNPNKFLGSFIHLVWLSLQLDPRWITSPPKATKMPVNGLWVSPLSFFCFSCLR
jgi:hypothetical protein